MVIVPAAVLGASRRGGRHRTAGTRPGASRAAFFAGLFALIGAVFVAVFGFGFGAALLAST